jgi:hypothetical protein
MSLTKIVFIFFLLTSISLNAEETKGFLTEDEIALFYKQGYILKPNCLSSSEMKQLNEDMTTAINRALDEIQVTNDSACTEDKIIHIDGSRVVYKKHQDETISLARINGCGGMQPSLLGTLRSEKMVRTFFELLGTRDLEHLISQIHPKLPGDGVAYPKHRDIQFRQSFDPEWQDVLGNGSYAICIIPIDHMTPENGGLWIDRNNYPAPQDKEEDLFWIYAEPGDLIFMHPYVYHGSGPNLAPNTSRKTLLTGFCAFGANHKAYPGAFVNTHFSLTNEDEISMTACPWSEDSFLGPAVGH